MKIENRRDQMRKAQHRRRGKLKSQGLVSVTVVVREDQVLTLRSYAQRLCKNQQTAEPSSRQLAYAKSISVRLDMPIPSESLRSYAALSYWIRMYRQKIKERTEDS